MAAKKKEQIISIPKPDFRNLELGVVSVTPLVVHKFAEKAKAQMRDKHAQKATKGREKRDPHAEYCASMYWLDKEGNEIEPGTDPDKHKTGFGFKSIGFKAAAVRAGKEHLNMNMTFTRSVFHVTGKFVKIEGKPEFDEDVARVGNGSTDLRYRGKFNEWKATIPIRYNASAISAEQIMNLFIYAGFGVGIGEYRPERNGDQGQFTVA